MGHRYETITKHKLHVTCEAPECCNPDGRQELFTLPHDNKGECWEAAKDAGWAVEQLGSLFCPACIAAQEKEKAMAKRSPGPDEPDGLAMVIHIKSDWIKRLSVLGSTTGVVLLDEVVIEILRAYQASKAREPTPPSEYRPTLSGERPQPPDSARVMAEAVVRKHRDTYSTFKKGNK